MRSGCRAVIAAVVVLAFASPVAAQINPFPNNPAQFSAEDRRRMYASMRTVLETQEVGATASWESEEGTFGGVSRLTRTFSQDGMRCGDLNHRFTDLERDIRSFDVRACEVEGEGWKFAF